MDGLISSDKNTSEAPLWRTSGEEGCPVGCFRKTLFLNILLFHLILNVFQSYKENMSLTKKEIVKGLKEVTRDIEEGGNIDSSTMQMIEDFLKKCPLPTTSARKLSDFPAELLQLILFYLPLDDLKSAVLVCKRWKDVGERSKLWEDKKVIIHEGESILVSCAVEVARRRRIQSIQAIGLSSDLVEKLALEMNGYPGLKELDLGGGAFGYLGCSPIGQVSPLLFRGAFPNLVKINLSNTSPTAELLTFLFSSLSPGGTVKTLSLEEVDLNGIAPEVFVKAANLEELNIGNTAVNPQQVQALWTEFKQAPDLKLTRLSVKSMILSTVSPQALERVAGKVEALDLSNTTLTPTQCNAIFAALLSNPDVEEINLSDNVLSSVPPANVAKSVQKSRSFLLASTALTVHQAEAIIAAVASEGCHLLHTLDLSNNMLAAVETELFVDAIIKLQSATLYDCSLTVSQVC